MKALKQIACGASLILLAACSSTGRGSSNGASSGSESRTNAATPMFPQNTENQNDQRPETPHQR
jgi:hypothetical protein